MDQTTQILANRIAALQFADLSPETVHETKRRILDTIACAAGAYSSDVAQRMRNTAQGSGATIWFSNMAAACTAAGIINGTAARYLDMNDTILSRAAGHPSDMIPALIALAETRDATGRDLIIAIAAAYAVYGGLCDAVAFQKRGVDQSTAAAIGAAAGASSLLKLSADKTGHAISIALASSVTLYNTRQGALSDWKAVAGPNGAKNGVEAACFAEQGITGPSAVFDGPSGFKSVVGEFSLGFDPTRITNTHTKAFPVCYHGQAAVDAATRIVPMIAGRGIARVTVDTYQTAFDAMANDPSRWAPKNRETADHSIPYTVAVVLASGALRHDDYTTTRLSDPMLLDIMPKITVRADDEMTSAYPEQVRTKITVTDDHGQTHTAETRHPKGHTQNPMTDADIANKLNSLWPDTFPQNRPNRLAQDIADLDNSTTIKPLLDQLSW